MKYQYGAGSVVALALDPLVMEHLFAGTSEDAWTSDVGCGYGEGGVFLSYEAGVS